MTPNQPSGKGRDLWLLILYGVLLASGLGLLAAGIYLAMGTTPDYTLLGMGVLAVIVPAATYPLAAGRSDSSAGSQAEFQAQIIALIKDVQDHLLVSENAKRVIHREKDRLMMQHAIEEDIQKGEYDMALTLLDEMVQTFGYRKDAEKYRHQIHGLRLEEREKTLAAAIRDLDALCGKHDWEAAKRHIARIKRVFQEDERVAKLPQRLDAAYQKRKQELEREFLTAAERDEVDRAMELLAELDRYLTHQEAEQYRETARGVIGKKKMNLGVRFKLAVQDLDWILALDTGEQIIRDFPNSTFASEVRGMLDVLRERAGTQKQALMMKLEQTPTGLA